jgi:hypothetical protein
MATLHAGSGELIDIHPFGEALPQANSATLVRTDHLELFRLVLPAGKRLPQHQVASVITVQCIGRNTTFELERIGTESLPSCVTRLTEARTRPKLLRLSPRPQLKYRALIVQDHFARRSPWTSIPPDAGTF